MTDWAGCLTINSQWLNSSNRGRINYSTSLKHRYGIGSAACVLKHIASAVLLVCCSVDGGDVHVVLIEG
jgi:hypothetical protein